MQPSRRDFFQHCLATGTGLALLSLSGPKTHSLSDALSLDPSWRFHEKSTDAALMPAFDDSSWPTVNLPHCVTQLSWQNWDPTAWEKLWIYRRRFTIPEAFRNLRTFLHFEGVMTSAIPVLNGQALPRHMGGYLPFSYEITSLVKDGENVLAVEVDSRWQNVPPEGSPKGPRSIDYLEPGGIWGSVSIRAVPGIFLKDVFAKPVNVLDIHRHVEVACTLDAAEASEAIEVAANLQESGHTIGRASQRFVIEKSGETNVLLHLDDLKNIKLWDVDHPHLYELHVTIASTKKLLHEHRIRIGFREARFEVDGFFLNGRRLKLFGLNRHELYPYVGRAMPPRVLRRDAELLRREFNCNMVRCSHYPQSEAFLDACDELGLMVWEEPPGWQYLGDSAWKDLVVRDVSEMVRRDRNHPCVVIWGVRINESHNDPGLYSRTKQVAKSLDGTRPTSGSMTRLSTQDWLQDVFAFDDYHTAPDGTAGLADPLPGVPFFVSEAVGQFNYPARRGFDRKYRRAGDVATQVDQAIRHAQVHEKSAANSRYCGVTAWCAFDYPSLINAYNTVKCPGIADMFRVPKLGAAIYISQVDPSLQPVIEPDFYWDFGSATPSGPGDHAVIFSNCDRLQLFVNSNLHSILFPDRTHFPHLKYPPFVANFSNLHVDPVNPPELRIDGYLGNHLVLARSFSADYSKDQLIVHVDDKELIADGSDATRLVFRVADEFGAQRLFGSGEVTLNLTGPGTIIGDNPFSLAETGGVGAVWIRTLPGRTGRLHVSASHSRLGSKSVTIEVLPQPQRAST
jgi:beta-galactosidase